MNLLTRPTIVSKCCKHDILNTIFYACLDCYQEYILHIFAWPKTILQIRTESRIDAALAWMVCEFVSIKNKLSSA